MKKMMVRTALTGALAAMLLSGCSGSESTAPTRQAAPTGERLRLVATTTPEWKDVGATITSTDMAEARARIPGILQVLSVREGDLVSRGQVIGRVVDTRLGYESAAYGAQAAAAQAQSVQAEADLARIRYLYDNGVYARAKLDQAQAAAAAARAGVAAARAQQSAVGAVAGQGAILAPSSGRVLTAAVPAGSAVAPGMSIATITSGAMVLRLDLPESLAGQVRVGTPVIATGLYPADPANAPRSTVSRVYPSVTAGQLMADVAIPGIANDMVGRRVTARVAIGERRAIIIPRRYITTRFGIDYATLVGRGNSVSTIPVQIAHADAANSVEILSGVSAGDTLIAPRTATPR
jgi:RND family efflux transporter MFP subunit